MGFGRRSARKVESYLHSQRAPVVASDQNVVTSDPTGRDSRRRSEVEQPRRSRRSEILKPCILLLDLDFRHQRGSRKGETEETDT
ncbi:hypothetical protein M5K25_025441 [Dendrobium thyrsiflorum]|uniref:Uncharacterized protein n=1 Tax=Dendrobium thyrsiflorum TaxID=117978 RepID=A0ABD0U4A3_DENTH